MSYAYHSIEEMSVQPIDRSITSRKERAQSIRNDLWTYRKLYVKNFQLDSNRDATYKLLSRVLRDLEELLRDEGMAII